MKLNISTNKALDLEIIKEFYQIGHPLIAKSWPQIKSVDDIPAAIEGEYGPELMAKVAELKGQNELILELSDSISKVIGEPWAHIKEINIYVGACPIAPRFLDTNSFLLPYYYDVDILLNWAAHEMIHFLYFKKWAKFIPQSSPSDFEHPHPIWVLSEILVAVIGNDTTIQSTFKSEFNIYPDWQELKIEGKGLLEIFTEEYKRSENFEDFLNNSWIKYQELDKKHKLTKKLT
jgi:hypothetical protein